MVPAKGASAKFAAWFDAVSAAPESAWTPKDSGMFGMPELRKVDLSFTRAMRLVDTPELPKEWRPRVDEHEGFPLEFGAPEVLRYRVGDGMEWHHDKHRKAKDSELVHLGTLVVVRYSDDAEGGELVAMRDVLDGRSRTYKPDVATTLTTPDARERVQEALVLRGEPHRVGAMSKGERVVLKLPAYVRRKPFAGPPYMSYHSPEFPKHAGLLQQADRMAELVKNGGGTPQEIGAAFLNAYASEKWHQRQAYFYCD